MFPHQLFLDWKQNNTNFFLALKFNKLVNKNEKKKHLKHVCMPFIKYNWCKRNSIEDEATHAQYQIAEAWNVGQGPQVTPLDEYVLKSFTRRAITAAKNIFKYRLLTYGWKHE